MKKNGSVLLISLLCVLALTSCSKRKVETVDNSVEYKSAQKLPPLNKHATGARAGPDGVLIPNRTVQTKTYTKLDASLLETKKGFSLLVINAKPKNAWGSLEGALDNANVTVYGRNKEAGQFFVSCGDEGPITEAEKRRLISLFKRKKVKETEYCALQTSKHRRKTTAVEFVDRKGKPIKSSYASELYGRILNN